MIIQADKEGIEALKYVTDAALKIGGLQNLPIVNRILSSIKPIQNEPAQKNQTLAEENK